MSKRTIVRVGGRCNSERLCPYLLKNARRDVQRNRALSFRLYELYSQREIVEIEMKVRG